MLTLMLTIAFAFSVNATECVDSDGGIDVYTHGVVEGNWYYNGWDDSHKDTCKGLEAVSETYCNEQGQGTSIDIECDENYECYEGVCVEREETIYVGCEDTDGGKDYYTKSHVSGIMGVNGAYYEKDEFCVESTGQVGELYCNDGYLRVLYVYPPEGYVCYDGAFIGEGEVPIEEVVEVVVEEIEEDQACSDSDGGIDLYEKGTTTGNYGTVGFMENEDYCITYGSNEGKVVEYSCTGSWQQYHVYDCPSGYTCSDGHCVDEDHKIYAIEETNVITTTSSSYSSTMVDYRLDDIQEFYQEIEEIYEDILDAWEEFEPLVSENDEEEIEEELEKLEEHIEELGEELEEAEEDIEEYLDDDEDDKAEDLAEYYLDVVIDEYTYVDGMYDEFIDAMEAAADSNTASNVITAVETPVTVTTTIEECDGCTTDNTCLTIGLRLIDDTGVPVYCGLSGDLLEQKEENLACQNDFECKSNSCLSGNCEDLANQLKETKSMMEKISNWFSRLFGED